MTDERLPVKTSAINEFATKRVQTWASTTVSELFTAQRQFEVALVLIPLALFFAVAAASVDSLISEKKLRNNG